MVGLGEKMVNFRPFGIQHIAIPAGIAGPAMAAPAEISPSAPSPVGNKFMKAYGLDENQFPEIIPENEPYARKTVIGPSALRVIENSAIPSKLENELRKVVVEVAPTANAYQIPDDQPDLAKFIKNTLFHFNYYVVELGLNVMLGKGFEIPELLFEVDLECDGKDRTDVTAYDIAPDNTIKHIQIISGKISLGVTNLLKFMPAPLGQVIPDLLAIEINPWEFKWGFDKYTIDAAGKKNYHIYWKIYETNIVQGFNPTMILKSRKGVNIISARAKCIYKLKKAGWFNITPEVKSNELEIKIWPL